jgi:hypothetical protein
MADVHKQAALKRGAERSSEVEAKVREAMATIKKEMATNGGIYPEHGGKVSMNEVARRAGISETTLFSPKQKELGRVVKDWVEALKKTGTVTRMRVRRTFQERAEDWRKLYLALKDQHILVELELQDTHVELDKARQELAEKTEQCDALLEQMRKGAASKVTPIPKGKR